MSGNLTVEGKVNEGPSCFQCSKLMFFGYHCVCSDEIYTFAVTEEPQYNCKYNDGKRKQINGQSEKLLKFLLVSNTIMVRSIPSKLIGAIGVLKKYDLTEFREGKVKKQSKKHGFSSVRPTVEKFICLNRNGRLPSK